MTAPTKRKEAPAEHLKRALGLCVRAVAGDGDVQVAFGPGRPEVDGKTVMLPEPSRVPSAREIAVERGWADSLALSIACHDQRVHRKLAPPSGPARTVFESVERARIEAIGANRMSGMADNLAAKTEHLFAHGRFSGVLTREASLDTTSQAFRASLRMPCEPSAPPADPAERARRPRGPARHSARLRRGR